MLQLSTGKNQNTNSSTEPFMQNKNIVQKQVMLQQPFDKRYTDVYLQMSLGEAL